MMKHLNLFVFLITVISVIIISCSSDEEDDLMGKWYRVSDFDGLARGEATSFTIGSKGYLTGGYDGKKHLNDLWEYDMELDFWTQKASFPGTSRSSAAAFSVPVVSLLSVAATAESVSGTGVVSVAAEPHAHNAADNPSARQNKLVFFIYHSPEYFSFLKRLNQPSLNIVLPQAVKIQPFSAFITILLQIYGLILQQMQFYRKFHNHTASGNSEQFFFRHDTEL